MTHGVNYETITRQEMTAFQSKRLKKIVAYTYENVGYYRKKMDALGLKPTDIHGIEDISLLPFTTKKDLRDAYPFGALARDKSEIVRLHASSGTTGKLTVAGYTQNDIDMWSECMARSLTMAGATKNSTIHIAYGYGLFTGGLGAHYGAERLGASVVPASAGNTARQLSLLKDFGADILCCTPSYALFLADEIDRLGMDIKDFNLKAGVFGAEPWTNEMREEIEKRLNINAYDIYGLSEICGPGVGMECCEKNGTHINEDYFLPEIIDSVTQEKVKDGTKGELVFTTLTKEGMPLIRYRTRDITSLKYDKCSCGRTNVKIDRILGRNDDMIIIRGANVFPSQIETAILNSSNLVEPYYKIIVDRVNMIDTLEIQIEMSKSLSLQSKEVIEGVKNKLKTDIISAIGVKSTITLLTPQTLDRSEGKAHVR
ncbi:MAG: phenylacetate--CoA ligase [Oscillospiraceae bacterium]